MTEGSLIVAQDGIESKILFIRGTRVILDRDLANLYGVQTKALNQAVRRNPARFPSDFMFQLSAPEKKKVVTDCDHLRSLKFSPQRPHAFTEQGVAMLSSVLNSERAIRVSIQIMRTFTKLRQLMATHADLRRKIEEMEQKYDRQFVVIFEAIKKLLEPTEEKPRPKIGFHPLSQPSCDK